MVQIAAFMVICWLGWKFVGSVNRWMQSRGWSLAGCLKVGGIGVLCLCTIAVGIWVAHDFISTLAKHLPPAVIAGIVGGPIVVALKSGAQKKSTSKG
jgi:hypothetical protein